MTEQTKAIEIAVERMGEALFNFSGRMKMAGVFAAGSELTDANAASYERVVGAWQKLTDAIERSKLPTWDHYAEEPVTSDMVPRDVAESWKAKAENYQQERIDLLADISDMMANYVDNWPAPKKLKTAITLIGKTLQASRDEVAAVIARHLPQPSGEGLVERPSEAIEVLGGPYRQLDEDGVIVGVSRQAICETLTYLTQLEADNASLRADRDRLAGAVTKARDVFQHYGDLHNAKGYAEGSQKAAVNWAYAMEMDEALQHKDMTDE